MNIEQQLKEQVLEDRQAYPVENLHRTWWETEPESKINLFGKREYALGTKGYTKMIQFASEVMLRNIDVDYWMAIGPRRLENEPEDDYKVRMRFQNALLKYRPFIYRFPQFTKKQQLKYARKQQQKQAN